MMPTLPRSAYAMHVVDDDGRAYAQCWFTENAVAWRGGELGRHCRIDVVVKQPVSVNQSAELQGALRERGYHLFIQPGDHPCQYPAKAS